MKLALSICALTLLMSGGAFASQCPSNATAASYSIWAKGVIPHDQNRSATHACGKHISCNGGNNKSNIRRTCHWD